MNALSSALPAATSAAPAPPRRRASALTAAVAAWFAVAAAGQLVFAAYVLALYGGGLTGGALTAWNKVTPRAYVPGETLGNLIFGSHVLFTVVIVCGGLIQLMPPLRRRAPALHRWNGRLYLLAAGVLASGGVIMLLTRGTVGGVWQQLGTALNGIVIGVLALLAWRAARRLDTAAHRRWALRLFLAVSGVWFFRIGLMAWLMIWRAPVGFDPDSFSGPFLTALSFAQFGLPLLVLQAVFHAQDSGHAGWQRAIAAVVATLALVTAVGVVGATLLMWWPRF